MNETIDEVWVTIPEFPDYQISNYGRVFNTWTEREQSVIVNNWGTPRVCFGRERLTRSVSNLVAQLFVEPPDYRSDCVVIKDGDPHNVAASNLCWRPRQFAWRYARQFSKPIPLHYRNVAVVNLDLHVTYDSILQAGITEGVLFDEIWESTYTGRRPYPHHHKYRIVERV